MRRATAVWMGLGLCLMVTTAHARSVGGVKLNDTMDVGGTPLKLNGAAVRKKFIVSVYVGALYLGKPAHSEAEVITPDEPRALLMHFVHDVDAEKLRGAYKEGFTNNAKDKAAAEKANIDKFLASVPAVKDGDEILFVYVPGKGSTITFPGGKTASYEGKAFADAYLQVFIGKEPPTDDLKTGLLGR